jgi:hypothetical protein
MANWSLDRYRSYETNVFLLAGVVALSQPAMAQTSWTRLGMGSLIRTYLAVHRDRYLAALRLTRYFRALGHRVKISASNRLTWPEVVRFLIVRQRLDWRICH